MTQPTKLFDYYACAALTGIMANNAYHGTPRREKVKLACIYADLMLEERGQHHSVAGQDTEGSSSWGLEWDR